MHIVRLLLTVLYITPLAAIIWHTLSERLPTHQRIYFPDSATETKASHLRKSLELPAAPFLNLNSFVGYIASYVPAISFAMSTRYWDEIDWYIQEGTQKLCEMLNSENDDASSSKWSTGEEEDDSTKSKSEEKQQTTEDAKTENVTKKFDDISIKDEVSDGDSVKDDEDYMERSTSVEDENTVIIKQQTKVEELMSMCTKCSMMPPIYTYFTTGDEQVVSTVQLWNGVRFSSHPQITRDKAMEEAAGQALGYLKSELRENRPVSTSPPTSVPYYVPMQNLVPTQYYAPHAAYTSPVSYSTTSPQPYFLPSVPYTVLPQAPVVSIPPDYQQATMMHPQYRLSPHHYNPYVQHYPVMRLHVSPTHQPNGAAAYRHHNVGGAKPVIWSSYPKDSYIIQDKANAPRTEYKLLDQPPASLSSKTENLGQKVDDTKEASKSAAENSVAKAEIRKESTRKSEKMPSTTVHKKQSATKPKLAISFNKGTEQM